MRYLHFEERALLTQLKKMLFNELPSKQMFQRASTIHLTRNGHDKGVPGYGGGMFLNVTSTFSVLSNTTLYWVKNHATFGGAIYVADQIFPLSYCTQIARSLIIIAKKNCFFQLPDKNQ